MQNMVNKTTMVQSPLKTLGQENQSLIDEMGLFYNAPESTQATLKLHLL